MSAPQQQAPAVQVALESSCRNMLCSWLKLIILIIRQLTALQFDSLYFVAKMTALAWQWAAFYRERLGVL